MIKPGYQTTEFAATFSLVTVTALVMLGLITQADAAELEQLLILAIVAASGFLSAAIAVYQYIAQRTHLKETAILSETINPDLRTSVARIMESMTGE